MKETKKNRIEAVRALLAALDRQLTKRDFSCITFGSAVKMTMTAHISF